MIDTGSVSRRYTYTQIAEQLNRPETASIYKHVNDRNRTFTAGNVQALVRKLFPGNEDTQTGVNFLEQAKTWRGWGDMKTCSELFKGSEGQLRIQRLTVCSPLAKRLLAKYGDFLLIDCTFKLTIYVGRFTLIISVVDRSAHVHPIIIADVPGHREVDWLKVFNDGWDLVLQQGGKKYKPKTALLMSDREEAIDSAWKKSKWDKKLSNAKCTRHSKWNVQGSKMKNGQAFGPKRGKQWYQLVFATCDQSFKDGVAALAAQWRKNGDHAAADHVISLANTSDAPLHKWNPIACPYIASGGSESVNQLIKKTPSDGTRRTKLNFTQMCRTIVNVFFRSWKVLRDGPVEDAARLAKRIRKHRGRKGKIAPGRYAVMLAALQQLTWPAVQILETMLEESYKHRAVLGKLAVYANYKELADPTKKYEHAIVKKNGSWTCIVAATNSPCWQFKIRGIFCSHMCAYAVQTIDNGGAVDLSMVGKSSIPRCRSAELHAPALGCELVEPIADSEIIAKQKRATVDPTMYELIKSLRTYAPRGGKKGLQVLLEIIQRRLMGDAPGPGVHALVDEFMSTTSGTSYARPKTSKKVQPIYGNNTKDEGNKARNRKRNRGDHRALSTGRSIHKRLAVKQTAPNYTLSGINRRTDSKNFSLQVAQKLGVLEEDHSLFYLTPFTATDDAAQMTCLQNAGLFNSPVVGLDLEWVGPRYPTKRTPALIYDASLLVLSCAKGTVLYHLYQYQDPNSDGMHWPGPFLGRQEDPPGSGKWVAANKPFHGVKWKLPKALLKLLEVATFTGRNIKADITRLTRVFGMEEMFVNIRYFDVDRLKHVKTYKGRSKANGLSDWLKRETGYVLADKGNKNLRTKGWNTTDVLSDVQKKYATLDGVASYLLGTSCIQRHT